jgi:lipid II:glycine glycyltransferase (peptidoglycan interpeptide bridge formation enzyme)
MFIREVRPEEKELFNAAVHHPLQTWEWGEFRKATGQKVERLAFFDGGVLKKGLQVTFHSVPVLNQNIGYFPKGDMPDEEQIAALKELAKKQQAFFIKMEPNVAQKVGTPSAHLHIHKFLEENGATPGRPLFTKYSFQLDLTPSEEKLFANLASKTRYNVNLAAKKGVEIFENTTMEGMEQYLEILKETTSRQGFYAHNVDYFRTMFTQLSSSGMLRIFNAVYQGTIVVSWIMFIHNGVLYYPYGASRNIHREVMASNLLMWEMIRFGKAQGCTSFDMWGSLGPEPNERDPWFGFHRFKKGYGGTLVEFLGTYDLITNPPLYKVFTVGDNVRWKWLRLKTKLHI